MPLNAAGDSRGRENRAGCDLDLGACERPEGSESTHPAVSGTEHRPGGPVPGGLQEHVEPEE